jgi:inorganic pyrophosphatase
MVNGGVDVQYEVVEVFVEVPKGSRNKYEVDRTTGRIYLDRVLFTSTHYPADYGFVMDTLAEDGDNLDALVLMEDPTFSGCVIRARPVAMLEMWDEKGRDQKILCVPTNAPQWDWARDLDDIPENLRREIAHFFSVYKELEGKPSEVGDWSGKRQAVETISQARRRQSGRAEDGGR